MQVSARVDYALRALLVLASRAPERLRRDDLAIGQNIPPRYLEDILLSLRQAGFVHAQRGNGGGYILAKEPSSIVIADVVRAIDGPLALVLGEHPESLKYEPPSQHLGEFWVALRASIRSVMEKVTLADIGRGEFPPALQAFVADPDSWVSR